MTNSDYIAIAALAVALITTIANLIATYYTNRASNKAKLQEIAFEKRIEAFNEIYAAMSISNKAMEAYHWMYNVVGLENMFEDGDEHIDGSENVNDGIKGVYLGFINKYYQYRVFLPPNIDKKIRKYIEETLIETSTVDMSLPEATIAKRLENASKVSATMTEDIVSEMHKFIGYK